MQLRNIPEFYTGSPVDASDLKYRDVFIDLLWESLRNGHVLLSAPRRTGKTSVMDYMDENPEDDFKVVSINVQDLSKPSDFFMALLDAYHDKYPDFFRDALSKGSSFLSSALGKIKEVGYAEFKISLRDEDPDWDANWRKHGEDFLAQVRKAGNKTLFIIDEMPDMVLNMFQHDNDIPKEFLAWFRGQRLKPHPKKDVVRWFLGGSVNLSSTLDSMGIVDLINDLVVEVLPVLTSDEVKDFVREMLGDRGVEFDEDLPELVCFKLGRPIPIFMQMVTQELYRIWRKEQRKLVDSDVDLAFAKVITNSAARDKLQHYYTRIRTYYAPPKQSAAYLMLSQLSLSVDGLKRSSLFSTFERVLSDENYMASVHDRKRLFNQVMLDLENDFYICQVDDDDRYDFASGIMKLWWGKYYA